MQRRVLILLGLLLAAIIVGILASRTRDVASDEASPARHVQTTSIRATATTLPAAPTPSPTLIASASATPRANLAAATAQDLRERARYPHSSQPLRAGEGDPILRERTVSPNVFPGPNGSDPALVVFPEQVSFEHPEPIVLHAHLTRDGARVAAQSIRGEILDASGQHVGAVEYQDTGGSAAGTASNLEYTARVADNEGKALGNGPYLVRVRAITDSGEERTGTTGFLYSRPAAQPTGQYSDAIVDGNLVLRAQVRVEEAGRFHLEGTLYTAGGTPLAWAQNAVALSPGTQWIPLSFFGLILREHGEDGPYVLRVAALSTVTSMPNAKNRLVENAYTTGPYRAADFSDQPFNDPRLLEAAERLEHSGSVPRLEAKP